MANTEAPGSSNGSDEAELGAQHVSTLLNEIRGYTPRAGDAALVVNTHARIVGKIPENEAILGSINGLAHWVEAGGTLVGGTLVGEAAEDIGSAIEEFDDLSLDDVEFEEGELDEQGLGAELSALTTPAAKPAEQMVAVLELRAAQLLRSEPGSENTIVERVTDLRTSEVKAFVGRIERGFVRGLVSGTASAIRTDPAFRTKVQKQVVNLRARKGQLDSAYATFQESRVEMLGASPQIGGDNWDPGSRNWPDSDGGCRIQGYPAPCVWVLLLFLLMLIIAFWERIFGRKRP